MKHISSLKSILVILSMLATMVSGQAQTWHVGDIYTFPDGSQGVVCWVNPQDAKRGWAMALNDLDGQYALWTQRVENLPVINSSDPNSRGISSWNWEGKAFTQVLLESGNSPAAEAVDFYNGWYIPDIIQLRLLTRLAPFLKNVVEANGGSAQQLLASIHWSSSIRSQNSYFFPNIRSESGNTSCTEQYSIRPVRDFGDDAHAYWVDKPKSASMPVWPTVDTQYDAVVVYGADTFHVTSSARVHRAIDKDTLYEVVCASPEPYTSKKFPLLTDLDISTPGEGYYTHRYTLQSVYGCDSIITLKLKVVGDCEYIYHDSICPIHEGETFISEKGPFGPFGPGTQSQIIEYPGQRSIPGGGFVDTIAYYDLTVMPEYEYSDWINTCLYEETTSFPYSQNTDIIITITEEGAMLSYNGTEEIIIDNSDGENGNFVLYTKTDFGCDSIIHLHIDWETVQRDTVYESLYVETADFDCSDKTIGNQSSSYETIPLNNNYKYSCSQQIFTPTEVGTVGDIAAVSFNYAYSTSTTKKNNVRIYMTETEKSFFSSSSDWIPTSNMTLVYEGDLNCSSGWNEFTFNNSFHYNGDKNLLVMVEDLSGGYNGASYKFYCTSTSDNKGLTWHSDYTTWNTSRNGVLRNYRSDIRFRVCHNLTIEVDEHAFSIFEPGVYTYTDTILGGAANGCDSIVTKVLEVTLADSIEIPVTKVWDDRFNNDGFRPDSVTLTLVGTTEADTVTFTRKLGGVVLATESAHNTWDSVFTGLPKYDAGLNAYDYTLSEEEVPYYTTLSVTGDIEEGFTVTNNHRDSMVTFTLKKQWEDNGDQDGIRPAEVTVRVEDESALNDELIILSTDNQFTRTVSRPKFVNREVNEISVQEYQVPNGYTVSYTGSPEDGQVTITNTHVPDSVEIVVEKIWDDHSNNDGLRPDTIQVRLVTLIPDVGTQVLLDTILTHEGGWHANLGRWPKYQSGVEVDYSMEEDDIEGYTLTSVTGDYSEFNNRYTLQMKNWHKLDSITLTVVKVWDDNHNQDGREDVQMQLFHNTVNDTEFDPAANYIAGWEAVDNAHVISSEFDTAETSWANLPKYINGTEVRYAVKEIGCPEHYAASYTFGGELLAGNGYIDTITNRRVMFEPTTLAGLAVQKKLVGRDWMSTDIFEMAIIPVNSTQPMPSTVDTVEGIVYAPLFITADSTVVNDSVRMGTFAPIIFTTDDMAGATSKTFIYHIRELTSALSNLERIVGVTYGAERYQVNITVEANGSSLVVSNTAIYPVHHDTIDGHIHEYLGSSLTEAPMITNRYRDSVTVYHLSAEKQLTVIGLEETLQTGDYHFVMKPVGINAAKAPMPQGTEGTGADRIYTTTNEDDAVNFFDDEVEGDGLRFDYKELIAAGFTVEQLFEGIKFEYEVYEVIPDGATFNNDGTGTWTFTTVNSQGVMVDEIYDGIVHFRDIHVRMEEIDSKVVLHVYSTGDDHLHDYYLSDTGDTTFLDHNSPFYAQHHGIGGVPIFHNKRIARISVPVEKVWDDYHNTLNTRPEQITVTLLANGVETDSMAVLNEDNEWAYTFENLLLVTTEGSITYTVREDSVSHYQATYSGDMYEGLIITNRLVSYGEDTDCTNLVDRDQLNECSDAPCPATVTDVDGITYSTVKLDGYCWMAENLRTMTPNAMVYRSALSPDTVANLATYGRLYTWYDAAGGTETPERIDGYVRGICPNGWHLPTVQEINVLRTHRSDDLYGEASWVTTGLNSTGFNALPAGFYNAAADRFEGLHSVTYLHGDTEETAFSVVYYCCRIMEWHYAPGNAYSVRCVKDCE